MFDRGLSAYKGTHRKKGALGAFLNLVKDGQVTKGSLLIVESLDRLSREKVMDAFDQFKDLIKAGITLVTLQDEMEYDEESIDKNFTQLIISISIMARAYEESKNKSIKLKKKWNEKRKNIEKKKLTKIAPLWLEPVENESGNIIRFKVIKEAAKAINAIYKKKLDGMGKDKIAKELNLNPKMWKPVSTRNKIGGWRGSYIDKILHDRSVLGEFNPHEFVKENDSEGEIVDVRKPLDPIEDYYPAVIKEDLFFQVQRKMEETRDLNGNGGGQTGKATNLFVHLVKCDMCGAPMHFIDKGKPPKGGKYLHCDRSRRNVTENGKIVCNAKAIHYDEFESILLRDLDELDISKLMPNQTKIEAQIKELEDLENGKLQKLKELDRRIKNLRDDRETEEDEEERNDLRNRIKERKEERDLLMTEISDLQLEITELRDQHKNSRQRIDNVKEYSKLLDETENEEEKIKIRLRLRVELRRLIDHIRVKPIMKKPTMQRKPQHKKFILIESNYIHLIRLKFKTNTNIESRLFMKKVV